MSGWEEEEGECTINSDVLRAILFGRQPRILTMPGSGRLRISFREDDTSYWTSPLHW